MGGRGGLKPLRNNVIIQISCRYFFCIVLTSSRRSNGRAAEPQPWHTLPHCILLQRNYSVPRIIDGIIYCHIILHPKASSRPVLPCRQRQVAFEGHTRSAGSRRPRTLLPHCGHSRLLRTKTIHNLRVCTFWILATEWRIQGTEALHKVVGRFIYQLNFLRLSFKRRTRSRGFSLFSSLQPSQNYNLPSQNETPPRAHLMNPYGANRTSLDPLPKDGVVDWVAEGPGRRVYDDLTAIDWIFEYTKERLRVRALARQGGILSSIKMIYDSSQVWLVLLGTGKYILNFEKGWS